MQRMHIRLIGCFVVTALLLLLLPLLLHAQPVQVKPAAPPVSQPLASEGTFAVSLAAALAVTTSEDEVEAESLLGDAGITPRNGWIADYPVTPDVITELRSTVAAAAAGRISLNKDEALKRFDDAVAGLGLTVKPYAVGQNYEPSPASCQTYPNPAMINETYVNEGPPVVTYYCPPPDYYDLYAWVPCPFWWDDLWFPGFFILNDFHRIVHHHHHHHRKVVVISNHFNDVKTQRTFRIDPMARFNGKTFAGIGVSRPKDFISTGIPRSAERIFNAPRAQQAPGGGAGAGRSVGSPSGGRSGGAPSGGRSGGAPSGGRSGGAPSGGGGGMRR